MFPSRTFRRIAATALTGGALMAAGASSASAAPAGPQVAEGDSGNAFAQVVVTVTPSLAMQVVDWSTADGTAKDGVDYGGQASGLAVFAPLQTSKTLFIPVVGDTLHEGDETFDVSFSGLGLTSPAKQTVTIVDDDPAPKVSIGDVTVRESDGTARLDVSLSAPSGLPASLDWGTADGSASAPGDYAARRGTLTFAPGETRKSVSVDLADDAVNEPSESFAVRLSNASGATVAKAEGTATIADDDPAPAPAPAPAPSPQDSRAHVGEAVSIAAISRLRFAGMTRSGRVRLELWCPAAAGCPGAVTLKAAGRTIGTAPYLLRHGSHRVVTVRLSRAARQALARHHRLQVAARTDTGRRLRFTVKR